MQADGVLWEGLRKSDKESFLALYNKYYHSLFFIGLKEVGDGHLVRDTIQQLFLYLWEKRETIKTAANVKSYLITSFLRKLSDDWKKAERFSSLQVVNDAYLEDAPLTPEESLVKKDEYGHQFSVLAGLMDELPNRQKELLVLKFYEGLSYEEIVQRTGLSHRTVYNKIYEALKHLKLHASKDQLQTASI